MIDHSAALDLARLTAALVLDRADLAADLIGRLRATGVPREAVRETILQIYLFDGFPTALEGMRLLADVWPGTPEPGEPGTIDDSALWLRRGEALHHRIYGEVASRVLANAHAVSPELAHWMLVEGYGKVLSRPGLDIGAREVAAVAVLIVKGRPRQLHSHLRGALRVGWTGDELRSLVASLGEMPGMPDLSVTWGLLERIDRGGGGA